MTLISIEEFLFTELLAEIFKYLDPKSLLACESCCIGWKHIIDNVDKEIWLLHAQLLWSTLTYNFPSTCDLFERIQCLTFKELKAALLKVDKSRCLEKLDYQLMLKCHQIFRSKANHFVRRDNNQIYYPDWTLRVNPAKASYIYAKLEKSRSEISFNELCLIKWKFKFNFDFYGEADPNDDSSEWTNVFHDDFTCTNSLHDSSLPWRVSLTNVFHTYISTNHND